MIESSWSPHHATVLSQACVSRAQREDRSAARQARRERRTQRVRTHVGAILAATTSAQAAVVAAAEAAAAARPRIKHTLLSENPDTLLLLGAPLGECARLRPPLAQHTLLAIRPGPGNACSALVHF